MISFICGPAPCTTIGYRPTCAGAPRVSRRSRAAAVHSGGLEWIYAHRLQRLQAVHEGVQLVPDHLAPGLDDDQVGLAARVELVEHGEVLGRAHGLEQLLRHDSLRRSGEVPASSGANGAKAQGGPPEADVPHHARRKALSLTT